MFSDVSGSNSIPILRLLLMVWCNHVLFLPSHQQHPEVGDGVSSRNFGEFSHLVCAVCPRIFYWIFCYFPILNFQILGDCLYRHCLNFCLEFEKWEFSRKPIRISDDYKQNSFWSVPMI